MPQKPSNDELLAEADLLLAGHAEPSAEDCYCCCTRVPLSAIEGGNHPGMRECTLTRAARDPFDVSASREEGGE